jgi:hypothetical protein
VRFVNREARNRSVGNSTLVAALYRDHQSGGSFMRALIFILILAVVAAIVAVSTGMVSVFQTRPATVPTVEARDGKVAVRKGQAPAFDVQTGSVGVGSKEAQVPVPTVKIERGDKTVSVPAIEVRPAEPANSVANAQ